MSIRPPVILHVYIREVHKLRLALDSATAPSGAHLRILAEKLLALNRVRLSGGAVMTTRLAHLAHILRFGSSSQFSLARARVDALDDALRLPRAATPSRSDLASLRHILAGSAFHPGVNPIDWLVSLIGRAIAWLLEHAHGGSAALHIPAWLIGLALLIGIAILVVGLGRRFLSAPIPDEAIPIARSRRMTWAEARSTARDLAAAGRYREALHMALIGVVGAIEESTGMRGRGLTVREYISQLRHVVDPTARWVDPFETLAVAFEPVWFGHQEIGDSEWQTNLVLADTIVKGLGRRGGLN